MINVEYNQNRPTVSLVGKITDELALELIDEIRRLTNEQFFTEILLDIASPGGMDSALAHCVRALGEFRGSGLRIVTRVRSQAASAAAILLSLGDRRIAAPGARLQYHEGRVVGIDEVTGATATRIARGLANADAGIAALLAERARRDCGTGDGGNGRVRVRDFAGNDWDVVRRLVGRPGRKGKAESRSRLLKRLRRKVAVALAAAKPVKLARFYMDLFALDAPISPALAQNLHLIDAVSSGEDDSLAAAGECGPGALRVPRMAGAFPAGGMRRPGSAVSARPDPWRDWIWQDGIGHSPDSRRSARRVESGGLCARDRSEARSRARGAQSRGQRDRRDRDRRAQRGHAADSRSDGGAAVDRWRHRGGTGPDGRAQDPDAGVFAEREQPRQGSRWGGVTGAGTLLGT